MTPCQLAALTKDRGLFLLTHKCKASRTRTPTHTKQLVLGRIWGIREKIKSAVTRELSQPCSAATSNCDQNCEASLCGLTNLSCRDRANHQTLPTPRQPWERNLQVGAEFEDQYVQLMYVTVALLQFVSWPQAVMNQSARETDRLRLI